MDFNEMFTHSFDEGLLREKKKETAQCYRKTCCVIITGLFLVAGMAAIYVGLQFIFASAKEVQSCIKRTLESNGFEFDPAVASLHCIWAP
ncbi:hypothetical protein QR680_008106 [Steinernema hermaphroditum]|uniref:Uncharacterized protein n=1 Tax=Steinernema hermaphroditum TaxID=289476 RepID=A0AA39M7H3_9BILA|nr:hypothetical protein QR680_008106 [Steinernema hermaphroditum]